MVEQAGFPRRIALIVLLILTWMMFWNSASAFSRGSTLAGILRGLVALVLIAVLIDGRAAASLEGRKVPRSVILILALIAFVVAYGEVRTLPYTDIFLLGDLYLPGLISLVQSAGLIILDILLIWETVRLARRRTM